MLGAARRLLAGRPPGSAVGRLLLPGRGCSARAPNPVVFLDVEADASPLGRVVLEVTLARAPRRAAHWRGRGRCRGLRARVVPAPSRRARGPPGPPGSPLPSCLGPRAPQPETGLLLIAAGEACSANLKINFAALKARPEQSWFGLLCLKP